MKNFILCIALALASCISANAQKALESDEVFVTVGVNVPMYKSIESDVIAGFHYGHYYPNNFGFRAGFQYSPSVADIDNYFGIPLAVTFRTRSRSASSRVESAAIGAFESVVYSKEDGLKYGVAGFLTNIFDRLELHAGITPGFVSGKDESPSIGDAYGYMSKRWTEKPYGLALSLDAGISINCRIWRFDLKLMPAFHYNITENYIYNVEKIDEYSTVVSHKTTPVKWFFTFSGGLSFRF